MPVTLEIKDRAQANRTRGSKNAPSPPEEAVQSAVDAEEKRKGLIALGVWLGILVLLCLPWWRFESLLPFAIGMPLWCLFSILGFTLVAPRMALGPLQKEPAARVSSKNRPSLKNVLGRVAPILGQNEPETFVDSQATDATLRVLPKALIVNEPLFKLLSENEVNALAVRGVAHQRLGHAWRLSMLDTLDRLPSPLFKILVWPVWIYACLLQGMWLQHALQSADRVALLVVRNHSLLLSALVKEKAANDEGMKQLGVQSSDVTNWVTQRGHIGMDGQEISTQYKLGRAIHENPPFENRVLRLQEWSTSKEFEAAVEKLVKRR